MDLQLFHREGAGPGQRAINPHNARDCQKWVQLDDRRAKKLQEDVLDLAEPYRLKIAIRVHNLHLDHERQRIRNH